MSLLQTGSKKMLRKDLNKLFYVFTVFCLMFLMILGSGCSQGQETPPADENDLEETAQENGEAHTPEDEQTPGDEFIVLATTTSTYDSGLLDELLPAFTEKYGIEVRVVSQGTGQALETGKRGDADILLVHDRASELRLVEEGYFTDRQDVMYNDFIIVGPAADPAGLKGVEKVSDAFAAIASGGHPFVSRGDDSGTHRKELAIWDSAGFSTEGDWYFSVGKGMGDTLIMAGEKQGYTLTDRATYLSMKDSLDLEILLEGDPVLFNQYGIMAVNPEMHPHVKYNSALKLIDFMMSTEGQELTASFQIGGESLFFPGKGVDD
jgi:tungstate transport system substrate-binding protein